MELQLGTQLPYYSLVSPCPSLTREARVVHQTVGLFFNDAIFLGLAGNCREQEAQGEGAEEFFF